MHPVKSNANFFRGRARSPRTMPSVRQVVRCTMWSECTVQLQGASNGQAGRTFFARLIRAEHRRALIVNRLLNSCRS